MGSEGNAGLAIEPSDRNGRRNEQKCSFPVPRPSAASINRRPARPTCAQHPGRTGSHRGTVAHSRAYRGARHCRALGRYIACPWSGQRGTGVSMTCEHSPQGRSPELTREPKILPPAAESNPAPRHKPTSCRRRIISASTRLSQSNFFVRPYEGPFAAFSFWPVFGVPDSIGCHHADCRVVLSCGYPLLAKSELMIQAGTAPEVTQLFTLLDRAFTSADWHALLTNPRLTMPIDWELLPEQRAPGFPIPLHRPVPDARCADRDRR